MPTAAELAAAKRKVSAAVLRLPGVSGVGLPAQGLTVYLEDSSPVLQARIAQAIESLHITVPVHWQVSGPFRAGGG